MRELHSEFLVDGGEVSGALGDEEFPQSQRVAISSLQPHDTLASAFLKVGGCLELGPRLFVETVEIAHREFARRIHFSQVDEVLDEHAERCPPVADVIFTDHSVTNRLTHAHQCITDHRGPQVSNVHLFGNVRSGVIDDHGFGRCSLVHAKARVTRCIVQQHAEVLVFVGEVEESRSGHGHFAAHAAQVQRRNDFFGHVSRLLPHALGEAHRDVHLSVGMFAGSCGSVESVRRVGVQTCNYRCNALHHHCRRIGHQLTFARAAGLRGFITHSLLRIVLGYGHVEATMPSDRPLRSHDAQRAVT